MISSRKAVLVLLILGSACRGPNTLPPSATTISLNRQTPSAQLYVSDPTAGAVVVYDADHPGSDPVRRITDGIDGPGGLTVDSNGNLYVADTRTNRVTVYARGGSSPTRSYHDALSSPIDVAVDAAGDVFVANFGSFAHLIVEYPAGSDRAVSIVNNQCSCFPTAIAEEPNGDLLAAYDGLYAQTKFYRYSANQRDGKQLNLNFGELTWEAAGAIIAPNKDLIVARTVPGALLFFAPRGGNPKRTLQDAGMPRMLAADFSHNRLFVADQGARHIAVLAYPNGKQLGTFSGGLRSVYGVAFDAKP